MRRIILIMLISAVSTLLRSATAVPVVYPEFDGSSIKLNWTITDQTGINNYAIYRSTEAALSDVQWDDFIISTITVPTARNFIDALPDTTLAYFYRIRPYTTVVSDGPYSLSVTTAPYPDTLLTAGSFDSKVILTWNASPDPAVTAYNIYRTTQPLIETSQHAGMTTSKIFIDSSSANLVKYYYRIRSISAVEGCYSTAVTAVPFANPFTPSGVVFNVSLTAVDISWSTQTARASYDLTGYNIYRSVSNVTDADFLAYTFNAYFHDSGLVPGTNYQYRIRAVDVNSNTSMPYDFYVYCPGYPSAPSGLSVSANAVSAILTWNLNDPREGVTSYHVYRNSLMLDTVFNAQYSDSTVLSGASYTYGVQAENSNGPGITSTAAPVSIIPSAPQGVTLTRGALPGTLQLSWQPSLPFENITGYNVYRAPGSLLFSSPEFVTLTAFVDTNITTGTVYYYRISAVNSIEGAYSLTVSALPVTFTAQIQNLTATAFNNYAVLSWDLLPSSYDTTGYNIYKSTSPDAGLYSLVTTTSSTAGNFIVTGLYFNPNYYLKVAGVNSYGAGDTVNASYTYVTLSSSTAPLIPENFVASSQGDGRINLTWDQAPSGSGVTSYNIYRSLVSGVYTGPLAVVSSNYYTDATYSAAADVPYYYRITSEGGGMESIPSAEGNTRAFYRPYEATNMSAQYIDNSVVLIWDKPLKFGTYQSSDNFRIYRSTNAASGFSVLNENLTQDFYTDSTVNTSVANYYYKIKNYDIYNYEDIGQTVLGALQPSFQAPPMSLVAIAGDSRVTLIWRITTPQYYNIYRRESTNPSYGAPVAYNISFASKDYTDLGLTNGTTYFYMIKAVNNAGEGPASTEVSALPYVAVSLPANTSVSLSLVNRKDVMVAWNAASGTIPPCTLNGYFVLRSSDGGGSYTPLTFTSQTNYTDTNSQWNKTYYYLIKTSDTCGNTDGLYTPASIVLPRPENKIRVYKNLFDLSLGQPLKLRYVLITSGRIKVRVYTLNGEFVTELIDVNQTGTVNQDLPYESSDFFWDGKNKSGQKVAAGIYILSLETPSERVIEKVAVIK